MEITTRIGCRVACRYCPQSVLVRAYTKRSDVLQLSIETFAACLSKLPREVDIHFLGMSEPWLNPRCTDMVLQAHARGHRISVSTTLAGMQPSDVQQMRSVPFEAFILHLPADDGAMSIGVDDAYVALLEYICRSGIANLRFKRFGRLHPRLAWAAERIPEIDWPTMNRANNLTASGIAATPKVVGRIHCHRIRSNVLLPNGDVVLCCNDYAMRHVLGNLLIGTYRDLFQGAEFGRIKAGLTQNDAEILCRYCSEPCMKIATS